MENLAGVRRNTAPVKLFKCEKSFWKGRTDSWYEYVPSCYDGSRDVPLVIQLHGANWDGYRDAQAPSFRVLAEQKDFIVIYPNCHDYGHWECDKEDVEFLYGLILEVCKKYRIDRTRIYMQGMSNGEKMVTRFVMEHPEILAAAGMISGPFNPKQMLWAPKGSIPCIQLRGEKDIGAGKGTRPWEDEDPYLQRAVNNDFNRELWMKINQTEAAPAVHIAGKDNFFRYRGKRGDVIYWEIKDMGHVEPNYLAWIFWNYLYSGWRRVDGVSVYEKPEQELTGDADLLAFAVGTDRLFLKDGVLRIEGNGRVMRIDPPKMQEAAAVVKENSCLPCIYVPLEAIAAAGLGDYALNIEENIAEVFFTEKGHFTEGGHLLMYGESCNVIYNGCVHTLKKPCIYRGGVFYLPILEIAGELLQLFSAWTDDTVILSRHYCELTKGAARILKQLMEND